MFWLYSKALKLTNGPYIINGNPANPVVSDELEGAGTVFKYHRPTTSENGVLESVEYILASGPITTNIDIMVRTGFIWD